MVVAVGLLCGCTPAAPTPTPTRTPAATHSPVFASDADALKAATDAYAAYLKMSDTIAHDGGKDPERIKPFVTAAWYEVQLKDLNTLHAKGYKAVGDSEFDKPTLRNSSTDVSGRARVGVYLCVDVSKVRLVNSAGADVTPATRHDRLPLQVEFQANASSSKLLIDKSEVWTGKNFC